MAKPRALEKEILEMTGACEVVRRRTLHLLTYHYVTINNTLRKMVEGGLIVMKEHGENKHYILTGKGRKQLITLNPDTFGEHQFMKGNVRAASWERLMLLGDVTVMLVYAGYGVFLHNQHTLPGAIEYPTEAINSFYTAATVKQYLAENYGHLAYQYARICGVLFTPDHPYFVYHTRDVAMEIRMEGESNVQIAFEHKVLNKMKIYKNNTGTLIFGDRDMVSAEKIMENSFNPNSIPNMIRAQQKKRGQRQVTELLSADTFRNIHYIPIREEALPLLELHGYRDGTITFEKVAHGWFEEDVTYGNSRFLASMELARNVAAIQLLTTYMDKGMVYLICLDWQLEFWQRIVEKYGPEDGYAFRVLTNDHIRLVQKHLKQKGMRETLAGGQ